MKIFIYIFAAVFVIRLLTNIYRLLATKFYYYAFKNDSKRMEEFSKPVGYLFSKADTQIIVIGKTRRTQYQDFISNQMTESYYKSNLNGVFERTIGVYKFRIRQNFYPLYWLTLPSAILNIQKYRIGSFFVNIAIWLVSFMGAYFLERYLDSTTIASDFFSALGNLLK